MVHGFFGILRHQKFIFTSTPHNSFDYNCAVQLGFERVSILDLRNTGGHCMCVLLTSCDGVVLGESCA